MRKFQFSILNILLQHMTHYKRFRLDARKAYRESSPQNIKIHINTYNRYRKYKNIKKKVTFQ